MRVGDEPYPPLPDQQEDHASQPLLSSLPSHNVIMQAPIAEGQHQDPTTSAFAAAKGVEGEPSTLLSADEGPREMAQDVVMAVAALGPLIE